MGKITLNFIHSFYLSKHNFFEVLEFLSRSIIFICFRFIPIYFYLFFKYLGLNIFEYSFFKL